MFWNIKKSPRSIDIFWLGGLSSDSAMTNELGSRFLLLFADFLLFVKTKREDNDEHTGLYGSELLSSFP